MDDEERERRKARRIRHQRAADLLMSREEIQQQMDMVFFSAVGKSITKWSEFEGYLVAIVAMLLDTNLEKAGLIFFSINNFHTWLSIIDELFSLEKKFAAQKHEWGAIAQRLKKLNDTRVRLAHHSSIKKEKEIGGFSVLKPHEFDTRAKSKKHGPLEIDEILKFDAEIDPLGISVTKLLKTMMDIHLPLKDDQSSTIQ